MIRPGRSNSLFAGVLAIAVGTCAAFSIAPSQVAFAQQDPVSNSDLRRENDQLKERIARLEAQLATTQRQLRDLEAENARLKAALESGGQLPPEEKTPPRAQRPQETALPLPSDPYACPESLHQALVKSYESAEFVSLPRESRAEQTRYTREVERWIRLSQRDFRGDVNWVIKPTDVQPSGSRDATLTFQIYDERTNQPLGEPISTLIPGRFAEDIKANTSQERWRLFGVMNANPNFNPDRPEQGIFPKPLFIGPFAEFGFQLTVRNIEPI